jgi:glycerophosphoryl diester phosphodiesterase
VNIEIKAVKNLGLLLDLLGRYRPSALTADNGLPWILISSFDHPALMQLHQRACPWPLAPLLGHKPTRGQLDAIRQDFPPFSWHFYDEHLDFYQITKLREQDEMSFVYTVNDLERARELRRRGVAGIFTDLPSAMLALRED